MWSGRPVCGGDEVGKGAQGRLGFFDAARGLCVVSMVLFHFCYDLAELRGLRLAWFRPPFEDIWRASISWSFLFIAGIMCAYSRNNFRRAAKYGLVAFGIWVATFLAKVDTPISFGIIYCMSASTLLYALLDASGHAPRGIPCAVVLIACFLVMLGISGGTVGVLDLRISVPRELYSTEWLSWLGFPGPHFESGDYYPPLPYSLMFLVGSVAGRRIKEASIPEALGRLSCAPLEFVGRHALEVYILHQPVLLLLAGLL